MSATTITALVGGGIITVLLLIYLHQWREKARDARQRQLNLLSERARRYQRIATSIPATYLPKDLGLLLVARGQETIKEMAALGHKDMLNEKLQEWEVIQKNIQAGNMAPAPDPLDEGAQSELRKDLKLLFKFIDAQIKAKRLDKNTGMKLLLQTQYFVSKSLADSHVLRAKKSQKEGKIRVAIHHYHDAIQSLAKLEKNPLAAKAIAVYRQKIKELDIAATEKSKEKIQRPAAQAGTPNKLSAQLDEMIDEEDKWKRKQDYDD